MSLNRRFLAQLLITCLVLLSACNFPGSITEQADGPGYIYTAAALTVQATLQGEPGELTTVIPGTPLPPATTPTLGAGMPQPTLTFTPRPDSGCDRADFVEDVTVPDNTRLSPGADFVKTWRLRNAGTCSWTQDYSLVFLNGDAMNAPPSVPLTSQPVAPGETVDVSVNMQAPGESGSYRGEWQLRNAAGEVFGVGENDRAIWVDVDVLVASGVVYDFVAQASRAEWFSGAGSNLNVTLTYGGDDADPNGVAKVVDEVMLEGGRISSKVLLTHPMREQNGVIAGIFPEYTVQPGDRFRARIGFMMPQGTCGDGNARFELDYRDSSGWNSFNEWDAACDGRLDLVEVDISRLRGQTVQFILVVRANGSPQDDWAVWNSPLIENR